MSKRVAVLFSSGLDSTYLVWKNLMDGNTVFPIYIEIGNNSNKSILEKNRIKLLWKEFEKEFRKDEPYSESKIRDIKYVLTASVEADEDSLHFKQIPVWMLGLMFMQSMKIDEIQIGYVSNDDAIPYLKDIQNIYKSYKSIHNSMIPLTFPLNKTKKWEMFDMLPNQYRELIFSCENPRIIGSEDAALIQYEPCCDCAPCRTIISTDYYSASKYPENYNKPLIHYYAQKLSSLNHKVIDENGNDYYEQRCEVMFVPYQLEFDFDAEFIMDGSMRCDEIGNSIEYDINSDVKGYEGDVDFSEVK